MQLEIGLNPDESGRFLLLLHHPGGFTVDIGWSLVQDLPVRHRSMQSATICSGVLESLTAPEGMALLRQLRRVLVFGGELAVYLKHHEAGTLLPPPSPLNPSCRPWFDPVEREPGRTLYNTDSLNTAAYSVGLTPHACDTVPSYNETTGYRHFFLRTAPPTAKEQPLVSILIPAFRATFFKEMLASIAVQDYRPLEVVIGDDSNDETIHSLVSSFTMDGVPVHYHKNCVNLKESRNALGCFQRSQGEYIKFLYDDDLLLPGCISKMVSCLRAYPDATLVTARRLVLDAEGKMLNYPLVNACPAPDDALVDGTSAVALMAPGIYNFVGEPSTTMFRRSDLEHNGPGLTGFAGKGSSYNVDMMMWFTLLSKGDLVYLNDPLSCFRMHAAQAQKRPDYIAQTAMAMSDIRERTRRTGFFVTKQRGIHTTPLDVRPWWSPVVGQLAAECRTAVAASHFDEAKGVLRTFCAEATGEPTALVWGARRYLEMNDPSAALRIVMQAAMLFNEHAPAAALAGELLYREHQIAQSAEYLSRALTINPYDVPSALLLGRILFTQKNYQEGLAVVARILEFHRSNSAALELLVEGFGQCNLPWGVLIGTQALLKLNGGPAGLQQGYVAVLRAQRERCLHFQSRYSPPRPVSHNERYSIVIPSFNNRTRMEQCLSALFATTPADRFEIIVVDNASNDGVCTVLDQFAASGRIRLLKNTVNEGFSKACNAGIRAAVYDHIILLNNDTVPTPGWLEALDGEAHSTGDIGVVGACLLYPGSTVIQHAGVRIGEDRGVILPYHIYHYRLLESQPQAWISSDMQVVAGACMLIHRRARERVAFLHEDYRNGCEDVDYCFSIGQSGLRIRYCGHARLYHAEGNSGQRREHTMHNVALLQKRWNHVIPRDEPELATRFNRTESLLWRDLLFPPNQYSQIHQLYAMERHREKMHAMGIVTDPLSPI